MKSGIFGEVESNNYICVLNTYIMKNKLKNEKIVECPECLGVGYVYLPEEEKDVVCNLCEGEGKIDESDADLFDPFKSLQQIEEELDEDNELNY